MPHPMTLRAHHLVLTLFAGAITLGSLAALTVNPSTVQATCATGSSVVITTPSTSNSTAQSGIITLKAQSTPTTASGLTFMLTTPVLKTVGEATLSGTDWVLGWDSRNQPNGSYQLMAMAHFGTATALDCPSAQVSFNINNLPTQSPVLSGVISPGTWQGLWIIKQYIEKMGGTIVVESEKGKGASFIVALPSIASL